VVKKRVSTVQASDSGGVSKKKKATAPILPVSKKKEIAPKVKKAVVASRKQSLSKSSTEIVLLDDDVKDVLMNEGGKAETANDIFEAELSSSPASFKRAIVVVANRFDQGEQIINKWSKVSLLTIVLPNTIIEYVVISGIQLKMLRDMSSLYGIPFKADALKVILGSVLGGGIAYFLSDIYSGLVKSIPFVGKPIALLSEPAIAYVTTYAVGFVFLEHFERNGSFDNINLEQMKASIKNKMAEKYRELLKKKSSIGKKSASGFEKAPA
jgi:uncharacterized protein (DUF697 family)